MPESIKKLNWKKIFITSIWVLVGAASVTLLVAAINKIEAKTCTGIDIQLAGGGDNFFIDKQDVVDIVKKFNGNKIIGKSTKEFNLFAIEKELKKTMWISKAELFFDNNGKLQVVIDQKEPVTRIFTKGGASFYLDTSRKILPLCDNHVARVPVFTDFPSEAGALNKADSLLIKDIISIGLNIQKDTFLMSLIDQISINNQKQFEMIPKIGDQVILFGDASDAQVKFNKLKLFYKKAIPQTGLSKYNLIDLQYKDQVVAKIRGKEDVIADSLRTLEYIKALAVNSAKKASDSSRNFIQENDKDAADISIILHSLERVEDSIQTRSAPPVNNVIPEKKQASITSTQVKKTEAPKKQEVKPKQKVSEKVQEKKNKLLIKQKPVEKKEIKKQQSAKNNDY